MTEVLEHTEEKVDHKKRLDDWFDNKFLCVYQNPTNVEKARKELHRYQPTAEILEQIYEFVLADNRQRHQARQRGDFYAPACNCYTFFHESRWMDKLTPLSEKRTIEHKCSCGEVTKYLYPFRNKHYCLKCYDSLAHPNFKREVYDNLCRHNLGKTKTETREEWIARMKRLGRQVIAKHYGTKSNNVIQN